MISNQLPQAVSNSSSIAPCTDEHPAKDYKFITRKLSLAQVADRYLNAKPVVIHNGQYFKMKDMEVSDLRRYSFNWFNEDNTAYPTIREDTPCRLKVLQQKKTYHSSAVFFKPDAEEVLNQFPEDLLGKKVYFSTAPYGNGTIYDQESHAYYKGFFTGMTTFYEESESASSQHKSRTEEPELGSFSCKII